MPKVSKIVSFAAAILVLAFTVSGCATRPQLPSENAIFIGHDGSFVSSGKHGFVREENFEEHLAKIADGIRSSKKKSILIFVHGGLNTLSDGKKKLETIQAIASDDQGPFPIFVNWDSDFWSTYWEHLLFVRQGEIEPIYGPPTVPAILLEDLGRMAVRMPISTFRQVENDFKSMTFPSQPYSSTCPEKYEHYLHPGIQAVNALTCTLSDDFKKGKQHAINISLGEAKDIKWNNIAGAGRTLHYLLTFPLKYATLPLIDGFATPAWDNMVRRTRTMYRRPQEFDLRPAVTDNHDDVGKVEAIARKATAFKETGALARLLHALNDAAAGGIGREKDVGIPMQGKAAPQTGEVYEVTVIGHSMGTIALNDFIRNYDTYPNLHIKNIVYMAAACSIRDFERSIIPYLRSEKGKDANFYNLTLHPWNDARETNAYGLVARGSLLEWIDNFLTTPSTPMDRTLGKWENIIQSTHIIPDEVRSRIYIKGFPVGDTLTDGPQMHGEFDDYRPKQGQKWKFWKESFWKPAL